MMCFSEFVCKCAYDLFDEMVIYSHLSQLGEVSKKHTFKEWSRLAEWALYYFEEDNK